jgi:hypothetical protein
VLADQVVVSVYQNRRWLVVPCWRLVVNVGIWNLGPAAQDSNKIATRCSSKDNSTYLLYLQQAAKRDSVQSSQLS